MNWFDLHLEFSQWLQTREKPLGIMAGNDARARQVLEACKSVGLRVPEDVAILGVDNDEMLCELANPALTSIEYGAHKLGYEAAALLERLMGDKKTPYARRNLVPPQGVVARQSTDAGAIADVEVAAAVQFIHQRACDPIQVSDVLDLIQVSRSTLKRRFKAITGRTVLAEIQRVRIERAKQLLRVRALPLREIAAQTGFCSTQYLTTVFYQHVGQTPSAYRHDGRE